MLRASFAAPAASVLCIGLLLIGPSARSLEAQGTVDYSAAYTTNSGRAQDDQIEEWVHTPGATFAARESTASLDLDANYRYGRRIYTDSDFSNEDIMTGSANVLWHAVPSRLELFSRNTRSLSTERAVDPENPDNRQVVSNSTIGTTLILQPRRSDQLRLTYSYDIDTRDATNDDSRSHNGTASYAIGLSPNRSITLLGTYADNSYDNRQDATSTTAMLGYNESRSDFTLRVSGGYGRFDQQGSDKTDGGIYNADLIWDRSRLSSVSLSASRSIHDQASSFAFGARPTYDETVAENSATNAAFTEDRGALTVKQPLGANKLTLSVFASKQNYDDASSGTTSSSDSTADDNKRVGGSVGFSRELTRATTLSAAASFTNSKFPDQDDKQDEWRTSIGLDHRVGRRLNLFGGGSYEDRDARTTDSYDEWRFWVGVSYLVFGRR